MSVMRRMMMMASEKRVVNLIDERDYDKPNGSSASPAQYWFATYRLTETIAADTRLRFRIELASNYSEKTDIRVYNSSSAAVSFLGSTPIVNGVAEVEFEWVVYGSNNAIRVYAWPSKSSHPIPTARIAILSKI